MDKALKAFLNNSELIGKTNREAWGEYIRFVESHGLHPIGFRSFTKSLTAYSGLTTKAKYTPDGTVRIIVEKPKDAYDKGFDAFIDEREGQMFDMVPSNDVYEQYSRMCIKEGYPLIGQCDFSRRICSALELTTKTARVEGHYLRVFVYEQ